MNDQDLMAALGIHVGGPGDEFTSSGPHGETSLQAQQKASQPVPQHDDDDLLASVFGPSDDELLTAQGGAASDAAQQAINFGNDAQEQIIMDEPLPGSDPILSNPGVFDPPAAPPSGGPSSGPVTSSAAIEPSGSSLGSGKTLLLIAAALGVGWALLSK